MDTSTWTFAALPNQRLDTLARAMPGTGTWRTLDLAGDELAQPIERFRPLYRMAKDRGTTSQDECLRQSGIDEELFDVISGFEALSVEEK